MSALSDPDTMAGPVKAKGADPRRLPLAKLAIWAVILFLCVTPFLLIFAVSFGERSKALVGNGACRLPITNGSL